MGLNVREAGCALLVAALTGCGSATSDADTRDLLPAADLSAPADLATPLDLSVVEDATLPRDLTQPGDLRRPADLKAGGPVCDKVGTKSEGWYLPDGTLICWAQCAGVLAECLYPGTRSEGWYATSPLQGCNGMALIEWADCI